jgi:hypothetical protein
VKMSAALLVTSMPPVSTRLVFQPAPKERYVKSKIGTDFAFLNVTLRANHRTSGKRWGITHWRGAYGSGNRDCPGRYLLFCTLPNHSAVDRWVLTRTVAQGNHLRGICPSA